MIVDGGEEKAQPFPFFFFFNKQNGIFISSQHGLFFDD